jgi:hypothetical protein
MNRGLPPVHGTTFYAGGPDRDILICLGFWEGDKAMAKDVCRLMADLQTDPVGSAAQVMLCYRQDCALDKDMLAVRPERDVRKHDDPCWEHHASREMRLLDGGRLRSHEKGLVQGSG